MAKTKKTTRAPKGEMPGWSILIELISRFGIFGAFCTLLMYNASKEQYRQFIDLFILLKSPSGNLLIPYFVVLSLLLAFIGQNFFFRNRIKLKDDRISQLEKDLADLQNATMPRITVKKKTS